MVLRIKVGQKTIVYIEHKDYTLEARTDIIPLTTIKTKLSNTSLT